MADNPKRQLALRPDTAWHSISLTADFLAKAYVTVTVDGHTADLEGLSLAQVSHPDWGNEVALNLTTESLAAWPQELALTSVQSRLSWVSAVGVHYQVQSSPDLRSWFNLGPLRAGSGGPVVAPVDLGNSGGFLRMIANPTP